VEGAATVRSCRDQGDRIVSDVAAHTFHDGEGDDEPGEGDGAKTLCGGAVNDMTAAEADADIRRRWIVRISSGSDGARVERRCARL